MEIEKIFWDQVKDRIYQLNSDLFQTINDHPHRDDYFLVKARYNYGELIVNDGRLILPEESDYAALNCDYAPVPYCMILDKNCELFTNTYKCSIPLNLMLPGQIFGDYETLDYMLDFKRMPNWSIASGSKTVILLPKIQDKACYRKLANIYPDVMEYIPTHYTEQWNLFTRLSNCANTSDHWQSEILIFPQHWFDNSENSLCQHVLESAWCSVNRAMDELDSKIEWEAILDILSSRRITPNAYLSDITRHLIQIAQYKMPGFRPVTDETSIPLSTLEHIFTNVYQLKKYLPNFMHIAPIDVGKHKPLYYSINHPTFLLGASEIPSEKSLLSFLKQLNHVFQTLRTRAKDHEHHQVQRFELFHHLKNLDEPDTFKISTSIPDADIDFTEIFDGKYPNLTFCAASGFWRGSVKILPAECKE